MPLSKKDISNTLVVALGANLPSKIGPPMSTLKAVRPQLEQTITNWVKSSLPETTDLELISQGLRWRWSPLFETAPVGGPTNQPTYINAVLIVDGDALNSLNPSESAAIGLLEKCLKLERLFGRNRNPALIKWAPRSLDIDLLSWGELHVKKKALTLPHPRLMERNFVIVPLAAALNRENQGIRRLPPSPNWKE